MKKILAQHLDLKANGLSEGLEMNAILTCLEVHGDGGGRRASILTDEALRFLEALHLRFEVQRQGLLKRRVQIAEEIKNGWIPTQPAETEWLRIAEWKVPPPPVDLMDRRVEITGPTDAKMMINALNSGAKVFMADLED